MSIQQKLKLDHDSVVFVRCACFYDDSANKMTMKALNNPNHRILFLLSKICKQDFYENMPKTFTISTKNSILRFNIQMLKETSPVISKFIQDNPNENNYNINITDDDNILTKIEQLYQGKCINFKEEEYPLIQRFTKILQIKNCPNCLKTKNLATNEIDSEGYRISSSKENHVNVTIYQKDFIKFLTRDDYNVFKIKTAKKEYKCNIFAVYASNVIRQLLNADPTVTEYVYNFDDKNDEFQLICDFFNYTQIELKSSNIESLETIAKDLQINCIIKSIDNYNKIEKQIKQSIEKHQNLIDSINELFDLLYNIKKLGIEKVKDSIVRSKWSQKEEDVEELASFILQVIKPSFSFHKEVVDLLIELNKEANENNRLDSLIPIITKKLMTLYWPQCCYLYKYLFLNQKDIQSILTEIDDINLNNRCVYSFIRLLYKRGIIPKEEIIKRLKNYHLYNNTFNAFFLPELAEIDPHNFYSIVHLDRKRDRSYLNEFYSPLLTSNANSVGHCFYLPKVAKKYFPDKIEAYERMLDNVESDDEIAKSIREDDVDKLQQIINKEGIDIREYKVLYNIFDDLEEDQSLINYSALYGSIKCFNYLMSNDAKIDENTFYFSIYGGNKEIIKTVEQNSPKEEDKKENKIYSQKYMDYNCTLQVNSFWICLRRKKKNRSRFRSSSFNLDDDCSFDKYNDNNIQYQVRYNNDFYMTIFLNCCNINNQIAPTIAMHENELFDWSFQNLFVDKNKYGKQLNLIAALSAMNGNVHSLTKLLENGFHVTKYVISLAAKNGFYSLTKLLLDLYDEEINPEDCNEPFDYKSIVMFGNLSIFKLFTNRLNQFDLTKAILYSIKKNHTSIIKYVFDNINEFSFIKLNNMFLETALSYSLKTKTNEVFDFLMEQFKKLNTKPITIELYQILLNQSCLELNLPVTRIITDLILKEQTDYDFTTEFIKAASVKSNEICQFFLDKQVFIDFENNPDISELGSLDIELFERIINSVNPNYKFIFYECINRAIESKNVKVIEYLLNEKPPINLELFEAIQTDDVEIVDLILKYNSSSLFINQKERTGTALCLAIELKNAEIVKRLLSIPEIDPSIVNDLRQDTIVLAVTYHDIEILDDVLNFYDDKLQSSVDFILKSMDLIPYRCYEGSSITDVEFEIVKRFSSLKYIDANHLFLFLYMSCFYDRIDIVETLLQNENININLYDANTYNTPLMICLERKNTKIAELLLKRPETNINLRNKYSESALMIAVRNEEKEMIDLLLKDERFDGKESRLNFAFIYSKEEISKQLYSFENLDVNEEFHDPNSQMKSKINALMHAVKINDVSKIDMILKHPTFNIFKSRIGFAILIAVKNNNINVFRKLMALVFDDQNYANEKHRSILSPASKHLSLDVVDEILKNKLFNQSNKNLLLSFTQSYYKPYNDKKAKKKNEKSNDRLSGATNKTRYIWQTNLEVLHPETIPSKSSIIEIMKRLLEYDKENQHEIQFDKLLPNGQSFFTTIYWDFPSIGEVSEFLLSSGVDPNKPDKLNIYPLEHAIKINSIELVKSLVNTERIDYSLIKNGITYLHLAASNNDSTILSFLLEKNIIDVNSVDVNGETPLIRACRANCIDNINLLFKKDNLDYLHHNNNGKDALDILIQLPPDELESITNSREKYHSKLVSVIEEKINLTE